MKFQKKGGRQGDAGERDKSKKPFSTVKGSLWNAFFPLSFLGQSEDCQRENMREVLLLMMSIAPTIVRLF